MANVATIALSTSRPLAWRTAGGSVRARLARRLRVIPRKHRRDRVLSRIIADRPHLAADLGYIGPLATTGSAP